MIRPEHDDRLLGKLEAIQLVEHLAQLSIEVANVSQIPVAHFLDRCGRQRTTLSREDFAAVVPGDPGGIQRPIWILGGRDVLTVVKIPIALGSVEGGMRLPEADGQEKWPGF